MSLDLNEMRDLCSQATEGPWTRPTRGSSIYSHDGEDLVAGTWECEDSIDDPAPDAAFIAAARTAVPALLDALAERDAEVARLRGEVERLRERERALIRAKDADLDDLRHEVEARDVLVADVAKIAADAERWKADALPVMAGLQDLGRILGLRLGTRITGEAAADAARALVTRADAAEARVRAAEAALAGHPPVCEKHPDDDPIRCGWRSAVADIRAALATPGPAVQADTADYGPMVDPAHETGPDETYCRVCKRLALEHLPGKWSVYGTCPTRAWPQEDS